MNHAERCARALVQLPELESMPKSQFMAWLYDNEAMYSHFLRFAKEAAINREHFSAYMIRERVRWYVAIEWKGDFKVSNNLTPYIARVLCIDLPRLSEVFAFKGIVLYPPQPIQGALL